MRTRTGSYVRLVFIGGSLGLLAIAVACSSQDPQVVTDPVLDSGVADTSITPTDAGGGEDVVTKVDTGTVDAGPAPVILNIPSAGHARLFNVVSTAAGIYATGQVATVADATDFATPVVKILPTGALDTTFGSNGVAMTNVSVGGAAGEVARGIVVQQSGKIVVAGVTEHAGPADATRDIVVLRFNANGTPDGTFGNGGLVRIVFGGGELVQQNGLTVLPNDDLIVVGARKAEGRATSEFAIVKLKGTDGAIDTSFGGSVTTGDAGVDSGAIDAGADAGPGGVFNLAIATNVNPKTASLLPNGSMIIAGYTNAGGNKPILFKLTAAGALDTSFASGGVYFPETGLEGFGTGGTAEAYGAVFQGTKIVATGYGRDIGTAPAVGWINLRFNADGSRDMTYGNNGVFFLGVNGQGAQSRSITLLADDRVLITGAASPPKPNADAGTQSQFAAVAIVDTSGKLDTSFSTNGPRMYDLGGPATGRAAHFFWASALSPDKKNIAIVGVKGGITANPDAGVAGGNDQAAFLYLPTGN